MGHELREGDTCPVCGEPYDPGESGYITMGPALDHSFEAISWVRVCPAAPENEGGLPMLYVHTDSDIDVMADDYDPKGGSPE